MLGISEAVELTKKVGDLVRTGVTIGLQETIMELREAVLNAKDEVLRLREENQALRAKAAERTAWTEIAANYTLVKARGGAMVYETGGPPPHFACPRCFAEQKIHILQDEVDWTGRFKCPDCESEYLVNQRDDGDDARLRSYTDAIDK
jgi:hypothetical protein